MSLRALLWALKDAPVVTAAERITLVLLAEDSDGLDDSTALIPRQVATVACLDVDAVRSAVRAMHRRGLLLPAPKYTASDQLRWYVMYPGRTLLGTPPIKATAADKRAARAAMWSGCWMCGGPQQAVDHVKPRARGGADLPCNWRPACTRCNSAKNDAWYGPRWACEMFGVWAARDEMAGATR